MQQVCKPKKHWVIKKRTVFLACFTRVSYLEVPFSWPLLEIVDRSVDGIDLTSHFCLRGGPVEADLLQLPRRHVDGFQVWVDAVNGLPRLPGDVLDPQFRDVLAE